MRIKDTLLLGAALLCLALPGCGDEDADTDTDTDTDTDADPLAVVGDWIDSWGNFHDITGDSWTATFPDPDGGEATTSVVHVSSYDNAGEYLIGRNDSVESYNPDAWSRYDWTYSQTQLYYCQIQYAAATEDDALADTSADREDLSGGCAGYSWTTLDAVE